MKTVICENDSRQLIEYRVARHLALPLECRALDGRGNPHGPDADGNEWYPVSAAAWDGLRRHSPETLRDLLPELAGSDTLTPRG